MSNIITLPTLFTLTEAADHLGVPRRALKAWVEEGVFPSGWVYLHRGGLLFTDQAVRFAVDRVGSYLLENPGRVVGYVRASVRRRMETERRG